jgi:DNA segregation ATPase FtsK/SpoIIIE, S-DNA-T family
MSTTPSVPIPLDLVWPGPRPRTIADSESPALDLRDLLLSSAFANARGALTLALGLDDRAELRVADLARAPHLLIAGTTGSGKSSYVHALLASLLVRYTIHELRLVLIDTGGLEFPAYDGIANLLLPVVTDLDDALKVLRWCVIEIHRRKDVLHERGYRTITEYNRQVLKPEDPERLPFITCIIDDVTGLTMPFPEACDILAVVAEHGRAVGVHLVLVTSRPTSPFVTGDVKRLIPSRIAFRLPSSIDSRTVLDRSGAEHLEGLGTMLYLAPDTAMPVPIRVGYVSHGETDRLIAYLSQRYPASTHRTEVMETVRQAVAAADEPDWFSKSYPNVDPLFHEAAEVVIQHDQGSTSLLQRRLKIGYGRAVRLIDQLHLAGVLGPPSASSPREVLITLAELRRRSG